MAKMLLDEMGASTSTVINATRLGFKAFQFGEVYDFKYYNPLTRDSLEFWDRSPQILCLGYDITNKTIKGITALNIQRYITVRQKPR